MARSATSHRRLVASVPAALASVLAACGGAAERERPPDVLLVCVDTLRADRMSLYGWGRPTTPFLSALAEDGVAFEDVTSQGSWTLPSMTSAFHGKYVTRYRDRLVEAWPALPELMKRAGYHTIGVIANPILSAENGFARGFDVYDVGFAAGADPKADPPQTRTAFELTEILWRHLDPWLAEQGEARPPLFVYVHLFDPHSSYDAHPEYEEALAAPIDPPMPWPSQLALVAAAGVERPEEGWDDQWRTMNHHRRNYDGEVRQADEGVRRIALGLRERGVLAPGVLALFSDHGECLWERTATPGGPPRGGSPEEVLYCGHGKRMTREALGTPLVLWGEGVPSGVRVARAVENVDLLPTLLELCGLDPPRGLDGRSLVPVMNGAPDERAAVYSFAIHAGLVRELASGLELVLPIDARADRAPELYHLPSDPREEEDLAAARPEDVARLRALFEEWRARHPTRSSADEDVSEAQQGRLDALGYAGAGGNE